MGAAAYSAKRRSDSETGYARPRLRETSGDFKMPARRQPLLSARPSHDAPRSTYPRGHEGRASQRRRREARDSPKVCIGCLLVGARFELTLLDRNGPDPADSVLRGGAAGCHRVTASTHDQPP
jgi:hypothetical protein